MSISKVNGIYQVEKVTDITNIELYDLIFRMLGDIEDLILSELSDIGSCKLVIEKFYKNSCFTEKLTSEIFVINFDEQVLLLHECMNEKKIQDIFTGRNLGDLVDEILSLVFFDFTNLVLTSEAEDIAKVENFYLANIHGIHLPYKGEYMLISLDEIKSGNFPKELTTRGGKLHRELFSKQLNKITKDYSFLSNKKPKEDKFVRVIDSKNKLWKGIDGLTKGLTSDERYEALKKLSDSIPAVKSKEDKQK